MDLRLQRRDVGEIAPRAAAATAGSRPEDVLRQRRHGSRVRGGRRRPARRWSAPRGGARRAAARRAAATPSPAASRGSASSPIDCAVGRASARHRARAELRRRAPDRRRSRCRRRTSRRRPTACARRTSAGCEHRGRRHFPPCVTAARIGGDVDLAHPRVEAGQHAVPAVRAEHLLRERRERGNRHDRQIRAEREPLRHAAADADAGERAGARAERDAVEAARATSPPRRAPRATIGSTRSECACPACSSRRCQRVAVADGDAAPFGRRVERKDSHRAEFYSTGDARRSGRAVAAVTIAMTASPCSAMSAPAHRPASAVTPPPTIVTIGSLDQEGRGIARVDGKAVFVEGALPGEARDDHDAEAQADLRNRARRCDRSSPTRRASQPRCPHFGVCGGCSLQHFDAAAQVAAKQRALEDALVAPRPRAAGADAAADPRAGVGIPAPRAAVGAPRREEGRRAGRLPRAEVELRRRHDLVRRAAAQDLRPAAGAARAGRRADGARPAAADRARGGRRRGRGARAGAAHPRAARRRRTRPRSRAFADAHGVQFYLQPGGPATVAPLHPAQPTLAYVLPEFDLALPVLADRVHAGQPGDQPRAGAARAGAARPAPGRAHRRLLLRDRQLHAADRAPRRARRRRRGQRRARAARRATTPPRNGLAARATFRVANLFAATPESLEALGPLDKVLVDPPREGAIALVKALPGDGAPRRIVYVSCSPATLARDAAVLVHDHGYALAAAGVVNMFPHTAHVESIALFDALQRRSARRTQKNRGDSASPRCRCVLPCSRVSRAARRTPAAGSAG